MAGYETFLLYQAVKLHFTSDSYDFFKFKGKYKCSIASFEARKDRYFFHKLDRKYPVHDDLVFFLAANFFINDRVWIRELLTEEANNVYLERKRIKESLSYQVWQDLNALKVETPADLRDLVLVKNGEYPRLLTAVLRGEIAPETIIALDSIMGFLDTWGKKITDTIIFPPLNLKYHRYAPFLQNDKKKLCQTLKKHLMDTK